MFGGKGGCENVSPGPAVALDGPASHSATTSRITLAQTFHLASVELSAHLLIESLSVVPKLFVAHVLTIPQCVLSTSN